MARMRSVFDIIKEDWGEAAYKRAVKLFAEGREREELIDLLKAEGFEKGVDPIRDAAATPGGAARMSRIINDPRNAGDAFDEAAGASGKIQIELKGKDGMWLGDILERDYWGDRRPGGGGDVTQPGEAVGGSVSPEGAAVEGAETGETGGRKIPGGRSLGRNESTRYGSVDMSPGKRRLTSTWQGAGADIVRMYGDEGIEEVFDPNYLPDDELLPKELDARKKGKVIPLRKTAGGKGPSPHNGYLVEFPDEESFRTAMAEVRSKLSGTEKRRFTDAIKDAQSRAGIDVYGEAVQESTVSKSVNEMLDEAMNRHVVPNENIKVTGQPPGRKSLEAMLPPKAQEKLAALRKARRLPLEADRKYFADTIEEVLDERADELTAPPKPPRPESKPLPMAEEPLTGRDVRLENRPKPVPSNEISQLPPERSVAPTSAPARGAESEADRIARITRQADEEIVVPTKPLYQKGMAEQAVDFEALDALKRAAEAEGAPPEAAELYRRAVQQAGARYNWPIEQDFVEVLDPDTGEMVKEYAPVRGPDGDVIYKVPGRAAQRGAPGGRAPVYPKGKAHPFRAALDAANPEIYDEYVKLTSLPAEQRKIATKAFGLKHGETIKQVIRRSGLIPQKRPAVTRGGATNYAPGQITTSQMELFQREPAEMMDIVFREGNVEPGLAQATDFYSRGGFQRGNRLAGQNILTPEGIAEAPLASDAEADASFRFQEAQAERAAGVGPTPAQRRVQARIRLLEKAVAGDEKALQEWNDILALREDEWRKRMRDLGYINPEAPVPPTPEEELARLRSDPLAERAGDIPQYRAEMSPQELRELAGEGKLGGAPDTRLPGEKVRAGEVTYTPEEIAEINAQLPDETPVPEAPMPEELTPRQQEIIAKYVDESGTGIPLKKVPEADRAELKAARDARREISKASKGTKVTLTRDAALELMPPDEAANVRLYTGKSKAELIAELGEERGKHAYALRQKMKEIMNTRTPDGGVRVVEEAVTPPADVPSPPPAQGYGGAADDLVGQAAGEADEVATWRGYLEKVDGLIEKDKMIGSPNPANTQRLARMRQAAVNNLDTAIAKAGAGAGAAGAVGAGALATGDVTPPPTPKGLFGRVAEPTPPTPPTPPPFRGTPEDAFARQATGAFDEAATPPPNVYGAFDADIDPITGGRGGRPTSPDDLLSRQAAAEFADAKKAQFAGTLGGADDVIRFGKRGVPIGDFMESGAKLGYSDDLLRQVQAGTKTLPRATGSNVFNALKANRGAWMNTADDLANVGKLSGLKGMGFRAGPGLAAGVATELGIGLLDDTPTDTDEAAALKGMARGAGIGGTIGSFIAPGVGTAIGAGLGSLAGGAYGWLKNPDPVEQLRVDEIASDLQAQAAEDGTDPRIVRALIGRLNAQANPIYREWEDAGTSQREAMVDQMQALEDQALAEYSMYAGMPAPQMYTPDLQKLGNLARITAADSNQLLNTLPESERAGFLSAQNMLPVMALNQYFSSPAYQNAQAMYQQQIAGLPGYGPYGGAAIAAPGLAMGGMMTGAELDPNALFSQAVMAA